MKNICFLKRTLAVVVTAACLMPGHVSALPTETTSPYASMPLNLQGATFIPPNVMLFLDTSGSMCAMPDSAAQVCGTANNRIDVAARVTSNLFRNNTNVRWGLFTFDNRTVVRDTVFNDLIYSISGILRQPIDDYSDAHRDNLLAAVETARQDVDVRWNGTNTPVTEAYVEMVRYFAGMPSAYRKLPATEPYAPNDSLRYTSPIQYRCQRNFIIAVTDGEPTQDNQFSSPDVVLGNIAGLTLDQATAQAFSTDVMRGLSGQPTNDLDGISFDDADNPTQSISTYTVGFAVNLPLLQRAATNGGGQYFTANNETELNDAFQRAIQDIVNKNASVPAPVSISQPSTGAIQVGFNTENWSGNVKTYAVDLNGNIGSTPTEAQVPATGDRMIFTHYGASRAFTKISATDSAMLGDTTTFGANPEWTLKFLLGQEPTSTTTWRKRNGNLLGDFINTEPVSLNGGNDFVAGSNDGLLHYFRRNNKNHPFSELFAYAPSATLSKTQYVAKRDYGQVGSPHRFLVDGSIVTQDRNMGHGADKTLLVGTLGRGGKGIYALDLSKATASSPSGIHTNVGLWDWNHQDLMVFGGGINMGYTFGRPVIAKVKQPAGSSMWMTIVGNGYDSSADWAGNGHSGILFFNSDPFIGADAGDRKASVPIPTSGSKPGIGGIAVMDKDNDGIADIIYAGDRNGDLWRIDLKEELHNATSDPNKTMVYKLWSGSSSQPITMTPTLYRINEDEVMVLFGTGSMLQDADKNDKTQQSVYGIRDNISDAPTEYTYADRGVKLLKQEILDTETTGSDSYRKVSKNQTLSGGVKPNGWYLDLSIGASSAERVTQSMMVLSNGVFFTTQIPSVTSTDRCNGSAGEGWIMALSAVTGSAPIKPVFSPAEVHFGSGASTVGGFKSNTMGMPSALGLISSGSGTSFSSYTNLNGMITNMEYNYMESGLNQHLQLTYGCGEGKLCTVPILSDSSTMQGYRTSWREV